MFQTFDKDGKPRFGEYKPIALFLKEAVKENTKAATSKFNHLELAVNNGISLSVKTNKPLVYCY